MMTLLWCGWLRRMKCSYALTPGYSVHKVRYVHTSGCCDRETSGLHDAPPAPVVGTMCVHQDTHPRLLR